MTIDEREALIEQYKAGCDEVEESLSGFSEEELSAHPIEGKWSAREIVHHLADSESTSAMRLRKLLVEDNTQIQGYDEAEFARRLKYNERPMAPALAAFRAARETTAQILPLLSDEDFAREGTHSEHGRYSVEDWLKIYAAHAHNHAAQIRRLREELKK